MAGVDGVPGQARWRCILLGLTLCAAGAQAASAPGGWKTYRSEVLGWQLSYPPTMELKAYFGGQSAELRDTKTDAVVAELEVWPPGFCPREPPGTTAEALGSERVATVTQADGPGSSSSCGDPKTVHRSWTGAHVPLYEVWLTCRSERTVDGRAVTHEEGRKGPTFFADISQPWRTRVLTVDPVGVDPRVPTPPADVAAIREVLATLRTFARPDPRTVCIGDGPHRFATPNENVVVP
jgi:hypothetical protein